MKDEIETLLNFFEGIEAPLKWYLGVRIHIEQHQLIISQSAYIRQYLKAFGLQNCRSYVTQ